MNNVEERLGAAARAAAGTVADGSAPPLALPPSTDHARLAPGWSRWRRWQRWAAPAAAALAVLAIVAALVAIGLSANGRHAVRRSTPLFAGGGRILLYVPGQGLEWAYPDGRTTEIARGFIGAGLVIGNTRLLAWRPTQNPRVKPPCQGCFGGLDYYLMNLNGTGRRLLLRAEPKVGHDSVELSPDGSRLAYFRLEGSPPNGSEQLWVADLVTGKRTELWAPRGSGYAEAVWASDSVLVTDSLNGAALRKINVITGRVTAYLSVTDPRIVGGYERARPGAGPPKTIAPELQAWTGLEVGWSTDARHSAFTVTLSGGSQKEVVALVGRSTVVGLAPDRYPLVSLTWGPAGRFVLDSTLAEGAAPPNLYAGSAGSPTLYHLPSHGTATGFAFSPDGTMIAEGYESGTVYIVPTPSQPCHGSARCGTRHTSVLGVSGILYGWARP